VRLPDSLEDRNAAGFYWDYFPPAGLDTLRVFGTTDLATAQEIRSAMERAQRGVRALPAGRGDGPAKQPSPFAALAQGLAARTRRQDDAPAAAGATQSLPRQSDWTAASVTVLVEE
jgi:hypothetical protein